MAIKILILAALALLFFGKGRISDLMDDLAKGIRGFRQGLSENDDEDSPAAARVQEQAALPAPEGTLVSPEAAPRDA
jgi:sec-independent protein translocase protein TatA